MNPIHIGKSSMGWKFLFRSVPGIDNAISGEPLNTYDRWINFLKEYTENDTIVIMNEYDEEVTLNQFIEMVQRKQVEKSERFFGYYIYVVDGYRFATGEFS